ncbi:MAG: NlpC/P60 family protein [Pseudomonadota bacterium]
MTSNEDDRRLRSHIVREALSWLSTPYRHQASAKGQGADCLGLIRGVHQSLYSTVSEVPPPYRPSPRQWGEGEPLLSAAQRHLQKTDTPRLGDVVLFRLNRHAPISHCGIVLEADQFIHAYHGRGVIITAFSRYWQRRLAAAFSFPETS